MYAADAVKFLIRDEFRSHLYLVVRCYNFSVLTIFLCSALAFLSFSEPPRRSTRTAAATAATAAAKSERARLSRRCRTGSTQLRVNSLRVRANINFIIRGRHGRIIYYSCFCFVRVPRVCVIYAGYDVYRNDNCDRRPFVYKKEGLASNASQCFIPITLNVAMHVYKTQTLLSEEPKNMYHPDESYSYYLCTINSHETFGMLANCCHCGST
uniref:Uncharacterized protein n=1 Tax=Trichogramma kaykai TaxID=54128 RepID=A0ABD2WLK8_9HYME